MSKQGRDNHPGSFLDWAWWIGMLGLVVTIIFFVILAGFTVAVALFNHENNPDQLFVSLSMFFAFILPLSLIFSLAQQQQQQQQQQLWNYYPPTAYPYYNNQWYPQYQSNISPLVEMMARQHYLEYTQAQQQFGYPYEQSFINTYF